MILTAFSKYLQRHKKLIINNKLTTNVLLCKWLKTIILKKPKTHIEKVIHKEIMFAQNSVGDFFIVGKSESGRILLNALDKFALSYENYIMSKWLSDKKPAHFINYSDKNNKLP